MRTCLVILAVMIVVNSVCGRYEDSYEDFDEDHRLAKDSPRLLENEQFGEEKKVIYDLADAPRLFEKFIKDYNKHYKDEDEYEMRFKNFVQTLKEINEVNSSGASYTADINLFADLGEEEFVPFTGGSLQ